MTDNIAQNQIPVSRVLIIDDDPFMLKIIERILKVMGVNNVNACLSGREGLDVIKAMNDEIDIILLDLNMPEMDGIQFIRLLDEQQFRGSVILISGEDERMLISAEKLVAARQISILGHLQKPITQENLAVLLNRW